MFDGASKDGTRWAKGYEGIYSADYQGQIWRHWKNRTPTPVKGAWSGNKVVTKLAKDRKYKEVTYRRAVYEAWNGEIPKTHVLTHKNKNPWDFHVDNLKPVKKAVRARVTGAKSRSKAVELLGDDGQVLDSWPSARKAAEDLFLSRQTVTDYCNKKVKKPSVRVRWARKEKA